MNKHEFPNFIRGNKVPFSRLPNIKGHNHTIDGYAKHPSARASCGDVIYARVGYMGTKEVPGEEIPFEAGQIVKTTDGRTARILATDSKARMGGAATPIVFEVAPTCGTGVSVYLTHEDGTLPFLDFRLVKNRKPASKVPELILDPAPGVIVG